MTDNTISITITVVSFAISLAFAIGIAIYQWRKAKKADNEIVEIKKAMTSYKYIKEFAFTHYANGNYEESLDAFRKYLLNNKDEKEWNEIINNIFRKETEKIFSGRLLFNDNYFPSIPMIIQTYISHDSEFDKSSPYPVLVKTLLNDYGNTFKRNRYFSAFMIALFDKDWKRAVQLVPAFDVHPDQKITSAFKDYITNYLNIKLGINNNVNDDNFSDDIPF
jgi:tetratricopeptide (TPR) repeat protein